MGGTTILKYLTKKDIFLIIVCCVFVLFQVYLELQIPYYTERMIRLPQGASLAQVMEYGWLMIACAVVSLMCAVITAYLSTMVALSLGANLREMTFGKIQTFSMAEVNRFSTPSLITRSTGDIVRVQTFLAIAMVIIVRAPAMAIIAMFNISGDNPDWMLAVGVAVGVVFFFITIALVYVVPCFQKVQRYIDKLNGIIVENLKGIRVIRAFNAEKNRSGVFEDINGPYTSNELKALSVMSLMMPALTALIGILTVAIYFLGARLIEGDPSSGQIIFGQMIVFSQYAVQIIMSIIMLVIVLMNFSRAMVSSRRIEEVLDTVPSINDGSVTEGKAGHEGEIVFSKVSFRYPGASADTLSDISFEATKGETLAIIGPTGCGKTSIVNLISRFYDCTSGDVLVDGVNVKDYRLESLYGKFGYVPQKSVIFNGTVENNIRIGREDEVSSKKDLDRAIDIAQASEFVNGLSDGTDTMISEGGTNLSGGQKQRISIARAICRKPEFYIFDDSFSALDYKTDKTLREAIRKDTKDITTVIVAQRISTIKDADKILVIDEGRLVGIGKHDELLTTCDVYREIANSQLTPEELVR